MRVHFCLFDVIFKSLGRIFFFYMLVQSCGSNCSVQHDVKTQTEQTSTAACLVVSQAFTGMATISSSGRITTECIAAMPGEIEPQGFGSFANWNKVWVCLFVCFCMYVMCGHLATPFQPFHFIKTPTLFFFYTFLMWKQL